MLIIHLLYIPHGNVEQRPCLLCHKSGACIETVVSCVIGSIGSVGVFESLCKIMWKINHFDRRPNPAHSWEGYCDGEILSSSSHK